MPSSTITWGVETSEYQFHVVWNELTTNEEIGGTPITSYNLQMYDLTATAWVDLVGTSSDYL